MKLISIVTPCYNEEENIEEVYNQVKNIFSKLPNYNYDQIFIDNFSTDKTVEILRNITKDDSNVKVILNARNFGHIRSPYYGLLQANGDAVILISSDLQDPVDMIPKFLDKWEDGCKIVIGIKNKSEENKLMFFIRKIFYFILTNISETELIKNFTGFGLYDMKFIKVLRELNDPYPFMRGIVAELGFERCEIPFVQPKRVNGKTSQNFYSLYDMAMLGFISYSKLPLRMASFIGFSVSLLSFLAALIYLILKIFYWTSFSLGLAPLIIGMFFFSGIQLFFLGVIGEYIAAIFTQTKQRPLVVEKERINFN
jgi:polyisoprenyl-phosphate glycosyltransferase